jgi:hypothetical protein
VQAAEEGRVVPAADGRVVRTVEKRAVKAAERWPWMRCATETTRNAGGNWSKGVNGKALSCGLSKGAYDTIAKETMARFWKRGSTL